MRRAGFLFGLTLGIMTLPWTSWAFDLLLFQPRHPHDQSIHLVDGATHLHIVDGTTALTKANT